MNSLVIFKIGADPSFKFKKEGEVIFYEDLIYFHNEKTKTTINFSQCKIYHQVDEALENYSNKNFIDKMLSIN
jgi:hypothetical protein